jgi:single-stranded DNA-binding protein
MGESAGTERSRAPEKTGNSNGREVKHMNYQKLVLVGNITKDAEGRTSHKGDVTFVSFTVAVGYAEETTYFPVVMFGNERKEKLAPYLKKGRQVLVEGEVRVGKNGKFNVVAQTVELGPGGKAEKNG